MTGGTKRSMFFHLRLVLTLIGAVVGTAVSLPGNVSQPDTGCRVNSMLVPSCGVLWGASTDPMTESKVHSVQAALGQHVDLVYHFHDLNDSLMTADERASANSGRLLHFALDNRIYGSTQLVTWRQTASGRYDAYLRRQGAAIAAYGKPVFVTYDHEPERSDQAAQGTPADFIAAWRHVRQVYRAAGAVNAVWVWVVMGYPSMLSKAAGFWPGNGYVDWISWEAYNTSGCQSGPPDPAKYQSFAQAVLPFYNWLMAHGSGSGIDVRKPMMISEAASVIYRDRPSLTAQWYAGMPSVLSTHPKIKAVALWDRPGATSCRYTFDPYSVVVHAVAQAMSQTSRVST
jgi:hypothetical protein